MNTRITTNRRKSRRTTYEVVPHRGGWGCKVSGRFIIVSNVASLLDKETFTAAVKQLARELWKSEGKLAEVVVHNRDGTIGKGKGSRTTYGEDPRKSKG